MVEQDIPQETKASQETSEHEVSIEQQKIQDLTSTLQHLQADFENYRKRVERDQERMKSQAKKTIVMQLLSVLDNFDLALKSAPSDDFAEGIEMIYAQLISVLEQTGVKEVNIEKYNPALHECLLQEESDKESGTILEVLQKGYTLDETLIRSAKVKLAK
jgi:molecular chaperone GrpE